MPCIHIGYGIELSDFHRNNWVEAKNVHSEEFLDKHYSLFVSFNSLGVEKEVETLVYDAGNFFAAIGGNLGLFLGFSCLSVVFAAINFIVRRCVKP